MVYNHCFQFPREKTMECKVALDVGTGEMKKTSFLQMPKSTEKLMVSGNESNKEFKRNIASLRIKYLVSSRFGMMIACYYANCLKSFSQPHI